MKSYLTVKEVAALLKLHWQSVLNYIKKGDLEAIKLEKGYRISEEAFERFKAARKTKVKKK